MYAFPQISDPLAHEQRVRHLLTMVAKLEPGPLLDALSAELKARNSTNPIALEAKPEPTVTRTPAAVTPVAPVPYEEVARQWYEAIGQLVVHFEHVCEIARDLIATDLNLDNTTSSATKIMTVMSSLTAGQLKETISMLLLRTKRLQPGDEELLRRFGKLIEWRNSIVHNAWKIGYGIAPEGPEDPWNVMARSISKRTKDKAWEFKKLNIEEVRDAIKEAVALYGPFALLLLRTPVFESMPSSEVYVKREPEDASDPSP